MTVPIGKALTFVAKHIHVSIARPAAEVYDFVSNSENLPQWAAGLSESIQRIQGDWIAESPMGTVKIKFAEKNNLGILDHDVTLPSGAIIYNPMRVFPNSAGSELVFTLYRGPTMSDRQFQEDAAMVAGDLQRLKALLEK